MKQSIMQGAGGASRLAAVALSLAASTVACSKTALAPGSDGAASSAPEVHACAKETPCDAGSVCDPLAGCVECLFDRDCADGERCEASTCVTRTSCNVSSECARQDRAHPICDTDASTCVQCLSDEHCGEGERCERDLCTPVMPCADTSDCPRGTVCDPDMNACVECSDDRDCGAGEACIHASCTPTCESHEACAATNQLCHPDAKACVQCANDGDCPDVYHCVEGQCERDTCPQGSSWCGATGRTVHHCRADGSGSSTRECAPEQICLEQAGAAACQALVCRPGTVRCSSDGTQLQRCRDDGQGFEVTRACEAGTTCKQARCVDSSCPAGQRFCDDDGIALCNDSGSGVVSRTPCGPLQYCNPETLRCEDGECARDSKSCSGSKVTVCHDPREGFVETDVDCADTDGVCDDGSCVPRECTPGERFCGVEGSVRRCNDQGSASTIAVRCIGSGQGCDSSDGRARCKPLICSPNQPGCDGNIAGTCNEFGTGLVGATTDCATQGRVCHQGICKERLCDGTLVCRDGDLHRCTQNGTATHLQEVCRSDHFCRETETSAACSLPICTPGTTGCDGDVVAVCNDDGTGWEEPRTDCAETDETCVGGTCVPVICEADTVFCSGRDVVRCGPRGATSNIRTRCDGNTYCDDSGVDARCRTGCVAGESVCRGNVVTTCKADGSGPEETGGTECAADQACEHGACVDMVCEPDTSFCSGNEVRECNDLGTESRLTVVCPSGQHCHPWRPELGLAVCTVDVCEQGTPSCDGEVATRCNSDGSGWDPNGTDCAQSGNVCNELGACAASAVDTVGDVEIGHTTHESRFVGNYYEARTDRSLIEIEQFLGTAGTSLFTWLVYRSESRGEYTEIFRSTTSGENDTMVAFHESGPIEVPLEAGHFYLIGVLVHGQRAFYTRSPSTQVAHVSFGRAFLGYTQATSTPPVSPQEPLDPSDGLVHQRLTTQAP